MNRQATRRLGIAALLFLAGVGVYLTFSDAPPRVHVVFIVGNGFFLTLVSCIAWVLEVSKSKRILLLFLTAAAMAPIATFASSLVIRKVEYHPIYVGIDFLGLVIESILFLAATWVCESMLRRLATHLDAAPTNRGRG